MRFNRLSAVIATCCAAILSLSGCASSSAGGELPPATFVALQEGPGEDYVIGPLDNLTIHVWRNPELGAEKIRVDFIALTGRELWLKIGLVPNAAPD